MTLTFIKNRIFGVKTSRSCQLLRNVIMDVITLLYEICKHLVTILLHGVISLPDLTSCDKRNYGILLSLFSALYIKELT